MYTIERFHDRLVIRKTATLDEALFRAKKESIARCLILVVVDKEGPGRGTVRAAFDADGHGTWTDTCEDCGGAFQIDKTWLGCTTCNSHGWMYTTEMVQL
jgi:hypothetical protein